MTSVLSILIPHYNDPAGLALTLASIESQTWKGPRKVFVCDDGSEGANVEAVRALAGRSAEEVVVIENGRNRGRPYTRNQLLDAADGKYLTWCDAGDEYLPEKVERQLQALHRAKLDLHDGPVWCTCNYAIQWSRRKKPKAGKQKISGDQINNLLCSTLRAYLFTVVAETHTFRDVGYFDVKLPRLQDLDFFLRFATKQGRFILPSVDDPLCLYHKTDVGRAGAEVLECFKYIYKKHAGLMASRSSKFRRQRQFELYWHAARFTLNNHETGRTGYYLTRSALYNPIGFTRKMVKNKGKL